MTEPTRSPSTNDGSWHDCATCTLYRKRRADVIAPGMADVILKTGETPDALVERFMTGVHARHLAGKSIGIATPLTVALNGVVIHGAGPDDPRPPGGAGGATFAVHITPAVLAAVAHTDRREARNTRRFR